MKKKMSAAALHSVAVELGRRGGKARATKASKKKLSEIGKMGADARWRKRGKL